MEEHQVPSITEFAQRTGYATIPGIVRHVGLDVYARDFYGYLMDFVGFMGETDRTNFQSLRSIGVAVGYNHEVVRRAQFDLMKADLIYLEWEWIARVGVSLNRVKIHRRINPLVWDVNEAFGILLKSRILKNPNELKATSLLGAALQMAPKIEALKEIAIPELKDGRVEQQKHSDLYLSRINKPTVSLWPTLSTEKLQKA